MGWGGTPFGGTPASAPATSAPAALTVGDIVYAAYRIAGMLKEAQRVFSLSEGKDGLLVFNSMLDAFQIERLMVYAVRRFIFGLQSGKQSYLVGLENPNYGTWQAATQTWAQDTDAWSEVTSTPDWLIPRPTRVERAGYIFTNTTPPVEEPMRVLNNQEWDALATKDQTGPTPYFMFYEPRIPYGIARLWPVPTDTSIKISLYVWSVLLEVNSLNDVLILPPGYRQFFEYELAVHLSVRFSDRAKLNPLSVSIANNARMRIKAMNASDLKMQVELMGLATTRRGGGWNILSNTFNGDVGRW